MPPVRTSRTQHDTPRKNRFIGRVEAKQNIVDAANAENIPPDTAYKILRKYRQTGTTSNLPRSGRPRIVTDREERHIIRDATNHRRKTLQELSKDTTSNLSADTVQKVLDRHGYHRRLARKKPYLKQHHRDARNEWAKYRKDFGPEDFAYTIFSDECYVCLDDKGDHVFVTRQADEEFHDNCLLATVKQSPIRVMVWGCIISGRKGPLLVLEYPGGRGGGMTAARYQEQVLDGALRGFYEEVKEERGCVDFQQDGAPSHTAKTTIAWFKKAGIPLAEHPAQSPDINPIEPVWHELKKILRSQQRASTAEGLKSAICAAWDALPQEVIDRHINKLPDVVEALLKAKGGHTQF